MHVSDNGILSVEIAFSISTPSTSTLHLLYDLPNIYKSKKWLPLFLIPAFLFMAVYLYYPFFMNILAGQYVLLVLKLGYFTNTTYGYIKWSRYIGTHKEEKASIL